MLHVTTNPVATILTRIYFSLLFATICLLTGCAQLPGWMNIDVTPSTVPDVAADDTADLALPEPAAFEAKTAVPHGLANSSSDAPIALFSSPLATPIAPPPLARLSIPPAMKMPLADVRYLTVARPNLWHRVVRNLRWDYPMNERTQAQLRWFAKNPAYMKRVVERATPYLYHIVTELEKNNLPAELALLPIIESAYRPFAYSYGRATGIWQFIPSTGRAFGLRQDWWYDGRRDIVAATGAAIRFFKQLENEFSGDWLHALAAYNAGPAKVRRAIRRNKKNGKPTTFWDLSLPRETRYYVPKMLAVVELIHYPEKYGVELPSVDEVPYFAEVDTGSQIDLARAADLADIDVEQLYLLNPGFNRWATAPDGPHRLLLPIDRIRQFSEALARLPAGQRVSWSRHTIQSGETLGGIAVRYSTTVAQLKKTNRIRGHIIRAGQALMIPGPGATQSRYALSADERLKTTQSRGIGKRQIHKVRRGDTLWDLAKTYHASVQRIARWNGISPKTTLRLGQKLVIWQKPGNTVSNALPKVAPDFQQAGLRHAQQTIRYTVRPGDSLDKIANRFKIRVSDLIEWNSKLKNAKYIHPGQKLRVRLDVRQQSG